MADFVVDEDNYLYLGFSKPLQSISVDFSRPPGAIFTNIDYQEEEEEEPEPMMIEFSL
jgi:hypothetical protein